MDWIVHCKRNRPHTVCVCGGGGVTQYSISLNFYPPISHIPDVLPPISHIPDFTVNLGVNRGAGSGCTISNS